MLVAGNNGCRVQPRSRKNEGIGNPTHNPGVPKLTGEPGYLKGQWENGQLLHHIIRTYRDQLPVLLPVDLGNPGDGYAGNKKTPSRLYQ